MKQLLKKLTETYGPSGHEGAIRDLIRSEVRGLADETRTDALGNLIVRKGPVRRGKGAERSNRIMIAAHMDEIGLIVTHVDDQGFVRFTGIGGVFPRNLPGSRVRFMGGTAGVIGLEPTEGASNVTSMDRMFIDVGATARPNCPVKTGDVAAFERPFMDLGDRVVAKSLDDRIGCAVAVEVLKSLGSSPHEVYVVFTTQEEVGERGAQTSAYGIDPDLGFSIDVTAWGDTPGMRNVELALGNGPAIKIRDTGMLSDPRIVRWMVGTAEKKGIPYQREVLLGGTTDARAMQLVRAGVPVGCISIPCRYVHSASEMIDIHDAENAVKLIVAMLRSPISLR
jgi:putative aminopeptidase FrvX